jgi:hypothetical protein
MTDFYMIFAAIASILFSGVMTFIAIIIAVIAIMIAGRIQRTLSDRQTPPQLAIEYSNSSSSDNRFLPPSVGDNLDDRERQELWIRIRVRNSSDCTAKHIEARFTSSEIDGSKYRENRPSWLSHPLIF